MVVNHYDIHLVWECAYASLARKIVESISNDEIVKDVEIREHEENPSVPYVYASAFHIQGYERSDILSFCEARWGHLKDDCKNMWVMVIDGD